MCLYNYGGACRLVATIAAGGKAPMCETQTRLCSSDVSTPFFLDYLRLSQRVLPRRHLHKRRHPWSEGSSGYFVRYMVSLRFGSHKHGHPLPLKITSYFFFFIAATNEPAHRTTSLVSCDVCIGRARWVVVSRPHHL